MPDLVRLAPFFAISAVASAWTIWEQKYHSGAQGVRFSESWLQRLAIAGHDIWFYLGKLILPTRLSFFYPQWKIDGGNFFACLPLLLALVGLGLLFWKRNSALRPGFVAAVYFVVSIFPVLGFFNVFFFRYSYVSDHFQYLAAMGPLALIAARDLRGPPQSPDKFLADSAARSRDIAGPADVGNRIALPQRRERVPVGDLP